MKNSILRKSLLTVVACLALATPSGAQELTKGEKDTIFIGRLNIKPSVEELARKSGRELQLRRIADSLDTQFNNALNATQVFKMVDRKRVQDMQEEQAFAAVNVAAGDKNAARAAQVAGAKYAFLPEIDGFEDRSETQQYQQLGRASMGRKLFLSASVNVQNPTTYEILPNSPRVKLEKTESVEMARTETGAEGSDQIIVELAQEMADKLCQGLVSLLRPAKVLIVTGKQITINRGTVAGFNKGDLLEIYTAEEIKDEDTGETYRNEIPVGRARITHGDARQSSAMIEGDDAGIAKGCVAKVVQAATAAVAPAQTPLPASAPGAVFDKPSPRSSDAMTPGSSDKPLVFE